MIRYHAASVAIQDWYAATDNVRPPGPKVGAARRSVFLDEILYHGSKSEFSVFRPSVSNVRGWGIFFSDSRRYAEAFGDIIYTCRVVLDNPKTYATSSDFMVDEMKFASDEDRRDGILENTKAEKLTRHLASDGFDGVVIERSKVSTGTVREVVVFDPASVTQLSVSGEDES